MYNPVWLSIIQCLEHVDILLWYLPLLLLLPDPLIPICVSHALHPIVKHRALLWCIRGLGHRRMLLLALLTFRAGGGLSNLDILSKGLLAKNLLRSVDSVHCFDCFKLLDSCWSLVRVRVKDDSFLARNWVLPPLCLVLDKMLLDWISCLLLQSKLLRLVIILFGSTFIPYLLFGCLQLFLLLIMWPLWV